MRSRTALVSGRSDRMGKKPEELVSKWMEGSRGDLRRGYTYASRLHCRYCQADVAELPLVRIHTEVDSKRRTIHRQRSPNWLGGRDNSQPNQFFMEKAVFILNATISILHVRARQNTRGILWCI